MSLHDAVADYIDAVTAGQFDMPRRKVADDLRAILAGHPAAEPIPEPAADAPAGCTEYAVLSFRDGLEPVDSLDEAEERMLVLWPKPGRARIMHRQAWAGKWTALDPAATGPALEAA